MSKAERLARQQAQAGQQAAEFLRQRQALAPRRIPVAVFNAYRKTAVRWLTVAEHSPRASELYRRAHPITRTHDGVVSKNNKMEIP